MGGAALTIEFDGSDVEVSMPHAALWVVQHWTTIPPAGGRRSFNAARGFVGGAATLNQTILTRAHSFNAARGFVGGAAYWGATCASPNLGFNAARGFVGGAAERSDGF